MYKSRGTEEPANYRYDWHTSPTLLKTASSPELRFDDLDLDQIPVQDQGMDRYQSFPRNRVTKTARPLRRATSERALLGLDAELLTEQEISATFVAEKKFKKLTPQDICKDAFNFIYDFDDIADMPHTHFSKTQRAYGQTTKNATSHVHSEHPDYRFQTGRPYSGGMKENKPQKTRARNSDKTFNSKTKLLRSSKNKQHGFYNTCDVQQISDSKFCRTKAPNGSIDLREKRYDMPNTKFPRRKKMPASKANCTAQLKKNKHKRVRFVSEAVRV